MVSRLEQLLSEVHLAREMAEVYGSLRRKSLISEAEYQRAMDGWEKTATKYRAEEQSLLSTYSLSAQLALK